MTDRKEVLLAFDKATDSSGTVSQDLLKQHLQALKLRPETIRKVCDFEQGNKRIDYAKLVGWLFATRRPGADMFAQPLSSVPADAKREVVLQTLVELLAAASWELYDPIPGKVRMEHAASTPEAYIGLSIPAAQQLDAAGGTRMAEALAKRVKELIAEVSISLVTMSKAEAIGLLEAQGSQEDARLVSSLSECECIGLHAIQTKRGVFRTPAVATVTLPKDLAAIPWQIQAAADGLFKLIGPDLDLTSLTGAGIGRLGTARSAELGAKDCNEAAKNTQQTTVALKAEAMHENSLAEISAQIATMAQEKPCVVVVAGPSSSGKTTFSCRLALHLQARGVDAQALECDMYYKARADPTHPRDEKGELNFEVPDALRLDRIQQDLSALTAGKAVELPKFDFKTGTINESTGHMLQLASKAVLIVEGIFGLHPQFLSAFQHVSLFKVLIGPWSGAQLSSLHVVPERKLRLLRRIGRDVRSRGVDAARVMHKFASVSKGEVANIFPYAGSADIIFDSALHYELPALKGVIGSDVESASSDDAAVLSRRLELWNYLSWVESWPMASYSLLPTSIACEFLGNSIFE